MPSHCSALRGPTERWPPHCAGRQLSQTGSASSTHITSRRCSETSPPPAALLLCQRETRSTPGRETPKGQEQDSTEPTPPSGQVSGWLGVGGAQPHLGAWSQTLYPLWGMRLNQPLPLIPCNVLEFSGSHCSLQLVMATQTPSRQRGQPMVPPARARSPGLE